MSHQSDRDRVLALEERAFNAWPALQTLVMDGWLLRFSKGYTKRANSVNAWQPRTAVGDIAREAAPLYRAEGLPLIFRLSPLADPATDAFLAGAGFRLLDDTIVMTASIDGPPSRDPDDRLAHVFEPGWADGFANANAVPPAMRAVHDQMLTSLRLPAAFAQLVEAGEAHAWGLAVTERGMVGLFDIATRPAFRRRGAARSLVESLLAWGAIQSATIAYLQVAATNAPAIALYRSLGFRESYRYHYRVATD